LKKFGKLKPRYSFILNKYQDFRASKCIKCDKPTFLRKFALLIHIDDAGLITLGKTCRYCAKCELIVVHQNELEAELAYKFETLKPEAIGNDYLVLGTVEKKFWQQQLIQANTSLEELLKHTADFKKYLDFEYQPAGWYFDEEK
jgi:MinD superfamily P-loop ATPase